MFDVLRIADHLAAEEFLLIVQLFNYLGQVAQGLDVEVARPKAESVDDLRVERRVRLEVLRVGDWVN